MRKLVPFIVAALIALLIGCGTNVRYTAGQLEISIPLKSFTTPADGGGDTTVSVDKNSLEN